MPGFDLTQVSCVADAGGWSCAIEISDPGRVVSSHVVTVSAAELARLAPDAADPTDLVRRSFSFLLEREPPGSILPRFAISEIGRYFPEYESTIRPG
jgi:hypothetical protein